MNNTNLRWGAYLARNAHGLYVTDKPPVCETCRHVVVDPGDLSCPDCDGTTQAWHVEITTADWIGGLVGGRDGEWFIAAGAKLDYAGIPLGNPGLYRKGGGVVYQATPIAPPPSVCTLAEALAMLPDTEAHEWGRRIVHARDCEGERQFWSNTGEYGQRGFCIAGCPPLYDTAPLELAIQHHKALLAFAAQEGWQ